MGSRQADYHLDTKIEKQPKKTQTDSLTCRTTEVMSPTSAAAGIILFPISSGQMSI